MKKLLFALVILVAAGGGAGYYLFFAKERADTQAVRSAETIALAPEVEAILSREIGELEELASNPEIAAEVRLSNERNKALSRDDILRLDREWQEAKDVTPFIRQLMENKSSGILRDFQAKFIDFKEVFVADRYGLNVGQTARTSDYYQADEAWWVESFAGGAGKAFHGKIEFDQSAQTEAISIYVPVMDGGKAIGVVKGVLDLSTLEKDL